MSSRIHKQSDWLPFQGEIIARYTQPKGTLGKVKKFMLDKHGLYATDKQYKRLFVRLGVKKHVKSKDWVAIGVHCQQRENEHKGTEVSVSQNRLSTVRVSRALARYKDRIEKASAEELISLGRDYALHTPPPMLGCSSPQSSCSQSMEWALDDGGDPKDAAMSAAMSIPMPDDHWETRSLDIPLEAMSDDDWGDIGSDPRKIWLYHLPSIRLRKLLCFGDPLNREFPNVTTQFARRIWPSEVSLPTPINHCWSWDELRSIIHKTQHTKIALARKAQTGKSDLTLCTEMELLSIVISTFSNEPPERYFVFQCYSIMCWMFRREHHSLLLAIVHRQALDSPDDCVLGSILGLIQALGFSILHKIPGVSGGPRIEVEEQTAALRIMVEALGDAVGRLSSSVKSKLLAATIELKLPSLVQTLLRSGANANAQIWTNVDIFSFALRSRDHSIIKSLFEHGATPQFPWTAITLDNDCTECEIDETGLQPSPLSYDMDMDTVALDYHQRRSIFTYAEACIFQAPSLVGNLKGRCRGWVDVQIAQVLLGLCEHRTIPATVSVLAKELALYAAAEFGNYILAQRLLSAGVDANCPVARKYVTGLLEFNEKIRLQLLDPLEQAFYNKSQAMTTLLLEAGACPTAMSLAHGVRIEDPGVWAFVRAITPVISQNFSDVWAPISLLLAVRDGNKDAITKMVTSGVSINSCIVGDMVTFTPLMCALIHCRQDMVEFLWDCGARFMQSPQHVGAPELSAVCFCLLNGQDMLLKMKFLLEQGASVNGPSHLDVISYVDQDLARPNTPGDSPLRYLLRGNCRPRKQSNVAEITQLRHALEVLLGNGADLNYASCVEVAPSLMLSIWDNAVIPKDLVVEEAATNSIFIYNSVPPLSYAIMAGDLELMQFLIEHGADVDDNVRTRAYNWDDPDAIHLLHHEAKDKIISFNESSALATACQIGDLDIVKFLVERGADVNANEDDETPLDCAIGNPEGAQIVRYLLEKGADVDNGGKRDTETSLHQAARLGHLDVAIALLEWGADLDIRCHTWNKHPETTALEWAARWGKLDMVKMLINAGAERNVTQGKFAGAIKLAEKQGHLHVVNLLRREASNCEW